MSAFAKKHRVVDSLRVRVREEMNDMDTMLGMGRFLLATVLLLSPCAMAPAAFVEEQSGMLRFDMGTEHSPVWPGFVRVTKAMVYTRERRYGWTASPTLEFYHTTRLTTGRVLPRPDALAADYVASGRRLWGNNYTIKGKMGFRVDLPNGRYRVYLLMGEFLSCTESYARNVTSFRVDFEGETKIRRNINERQRIAIYYRHMNDVWRPGQDVWEKYVAPRFPSYTVDVQVNDGSLDIDIYDRPLNAIMIYPASRANELRRFIEELDRKRKAQFPFKEIKLKIGSPVCHPEAHIPFYPFHGSWAEYPGERTTPPALEATAAEKEKGYVVYTVEYMSDIYPDDVPGTSHRKQNIALTMARGEYEPCVFGVYPLKPLKACRVQLSDLVSRTGGVMASKHIDVRAVKYYEWLHGEADGKKGFVVTPHHLVRRDTMDMEPGINRLYWLTVHAPIDLKPGHYEGSVVFSPQDAPPTRIALTVDVLPFELVEPDVYYMLQYNSFSAHPALPGGMRNRYVDMREHGFNMDLAPARFGGIRVQVGDDGKVDVSAEGMERTLKQWKERWGWQPKMLKLFVDRVDGPIWKHLGIQRPRLRGASKPIAYTLEFDELYVNMMRALHDELKRRPTIPGLMFHHVTSEGGGTPACWDAVNHLLALDKKAGVRLTAHGNTLQMVMEPTPNLDVKVICGQTGLCTQETLDTIRRLNPRQRYWRWGYYIGENRMERGLFLWRMGLRGLVLEGGTQEYGEPFNEFDTEGTRWPHVFPAPDGLTPTLWWERAREGVDDYRYLATLRNYIRRAETRGTAEATRAAREGEETINAIMAMIIPDINHYRLNRGRRARFDLWTGADFERCRQMIRRSILVLMKALGELPPEYTIPTRVEPPHEPWLSAARAAAASTTPVPQLGPNWRLVYHDDFNDGNAEGWVSLSGAVYKLEPNTEPDHAPFVYCEENGWLESYPFQLYSFYARRRFGDFVWVLDIRDGCDNHAHYHRHYYGSGRGAALVFRVTNMSRSPKGGYRLDTAPFQLSRWHGKSTKVLARSPLWLNRDTQWPRWHRIKVEVRDRNIKVYLDDMRKPVFELEDSTYREGYIGLVCHHFPNCWYFDNMAIGVK